MNLYCDALKFCIHDDAWLKSAFEDKNNLHEFTKNFTMNKTNQAICEYLYSKDITSVFKYKRKTMLTEQDLNFWFSQESEVAKINLIQKIKNKTNHYAEAVKYLLEDYCDQTRDNFDAKILPCPLSLTETIKPVRNFKVVISDDKNFAVEIMDTSLKVHDNNSYLNNLREYFEKRRTSKAFSRAYLSEEEIDDTTFNQLKSKLLYLKEIQIPSCAASLHENKYKILYRNNQSYVKEDKIQTLTDKNIKILHIEKVK